MFPLQHLRQGLGTLYCSPMFIKNAFQDNTTDFVIVLLLAQQEPIFCPDDMKVLISDRNEPVTWVEPSFPGNPRVVSNYVTGNKLKEASLG